MQNISIQSGSAIDSINAKMILMQNELSSIKSKNIAISDSLKTLNETILKADIKTSLFSDQLSFQLFCFSILLVAISFFSWRWIIDPINVKLRNLKKKIISVENNKLPKLKVSILEQNQNTINELKSDFKNLQDRTNISMSWGLKSMLLIHQSNQDYNGQALFLCRLLNLVLEDNSYESNRGMVSYAISQLKQIFDSNNFNYQNYNSQKEEYDELVEAIKNSGIEELLEFYYKHLKKITDFEEAPHTAIDVAKSDDLIPSPGQE